MRINVINTILPWLTKNAVYVSDYQIDMVVHGLTKVDGVSIDLNEDMWWLYDDISGSKKQEIFGKGFTLYGLLKDKINYVAKGSYDLYIVGLHHSSLRYYDSEFPKEMLGNLPPEKTIIIDGWDVPTIQWHLFDACKLYFKRELYETAVTSKLRPINFAFPREKVYLTEEKQENLVAPLIPVKQNVDPIYMRTYKYSTEEDYYKMYRNSLFGLTSKKGGWDTLRHYEIMSQGCIPYFVDIERCPPLTLTNLPKKYLSDIKKKANLNWNWSDKDYGTVWPHCGVVRVDQPVLEGDWPDMTEEKEFLKEHFMKNCLTEHLAHYILENYK